ncbi:MAG TPA: class I tRNA ligase family protein [Candidatus Peribacteraceae bacterium]|nr:class I tRNA ligase family protein [Candidatus Peribacteraceae bacterium]
MFDPVNPRQPFAELERGILEYWKEEDVFRRSIAQRSDAETFSFYDGPPFATGLPHYGHLLAGTIKDVIPRYQTMKGKKVARRFGWDCHGLPVEYEIEKEHDIKGAHEIEQMGIKTFNDLCRGIVQRYTKEWRATVERMGRFVDMDDDYKTMDPTYMESIWWVFQTLFQKGLIYEGYKPMHICPRCMTPLSNFEVTQGYKDITDQSATVRFELVDEPGTFILAWTTTPWTLPGNLFLAVNPDYRYLLIENVKTNDRLIVSEEFANNLLTSAGRSNAKIEDPEYALYQQEPIMGKDLIGKRYKPLFPYFVEEYEKTAFTVVAGDFVTTEDGTGIVHIAPGFGEDDFGVGQKIYGKDYKPLQHVSMDGHMKSAVTDFAGLDVKPKDDPTKTDKKVIDWLAKNNLLFATESYRHSYPHCWRCESPLLNFATSSWFVQIDKKGKHPGIKEDMLQVNAETEWVPAHLRDGRFGKWLEGARDWAISRNRFWGTPLPIWRSADGTDVDVIQGRDDLMAHKLMRFTKVSVVRHGESEGNLVPMYQGDVPGTNLTAAGKKQVKKAGEILSSSPILPTVIYCSPMARTMQTAQAIADATGAKIIIDERLREVGMGEHEGKKIPVDDLEVSKELRKEKMSMQTPQSTYHLPGMETWDSIQERINDFFEEILPKHRSEHIVVVSHGDPIFNIRHFFTKDDPYKIVQTAHAPYATPLSFFWDHSLNAAMDLHKDVIDEIMWPGSKTKESVELTLVRHGETDYNREHKINANDPPLNDTGHEQAKTLAAKLKQSKTHYDYIVSSNMKRAKVTADYLKKAVDIPHEVQWEVLSERNFGAWEGRVVQDVKKEHTVRFDNLDIALSHHTPEKGETLQEFFERAEKAAEMLRENYAGKRVLLVAHGGFIQALRAVIENRSYKDCVDLLPKNTEAIELEIHPPMKRIPEVLDCWFESGSMPYAQVNYPFAAANGVVSGQWSEDRNQKAEISPMEGRAGVGDSSSDSEPYDPLLPVPKGFPADFIAEGIDQTRGWFYTLTVLSAALFRQPAFRHCVVNGTVLAEDGRKMSKRLKNYPDPNEVIEKHGADALRFTLMSSPAVRAEDLRFSEKAVEETLRSVLLPLWNSYSFFVTYANDAAWEASAKPRQSAHPLDHWIRAEVQDLVNRMTTQLDAYDLSATCAELGSTIDALTNWYIRLSRRRFAGKGSMEAEGIASASINGDEDLDRHDALTTLYDVLMTLSQLLAPFCPFVTDAIYLNLAGDKHGSIHLTDWPAVRELTKEEQLLIRKNHALRLIVSLGNKVRSEKKIKIRQPLARATAALPKALFDPNKLTQEDLSLLKQELNVKELTFIDDPGALGQRIAMVDARKVGPRLGKRVQEVIAAGKNGEFAINDDGSVVILDETLGPEEVQIVYRGAEGADIAAEGGIVVSVDTALNEALIMEGNMRDLVRHIQRLRKENGYVVSDRVEIGVEGADDILASFRQLIEQETNVSIGNATGARHDVEVGDGKKAVVCIKEK